ncbi:unnamed protein product [marine sediment metagenome]|uniref:Uncharacterized protein n=1 Tax=marine sediment metagenome TaxID=412755 RepID=X1JN98_9ZZZZ
MASFKWAMCLLLVFVIFSAMPIASAGNTGANEMGMITTDSSGFATITFSGSYVSKPILALTPELPVATDRVFVQIESWTGPPYTDVTIATSGDDGKAEASVLVHWALFDNNPDDDPAPDDTPDDAPGGGGWQYWLRDSLVWLGAAGRGWLALIVVLIVLIGISWIFFKD